MRKRDDEKAKSIKDAVMKLILQEGFHGTSISKIAKEAGVSPATVYIYFDNKEIMLQDIYLEYSEEIFNCVLSKTQQEMNGEQLIEVIVMSYYNYILENERIFNFVDQFSSCPSLANHCSDIRGIGCMNNLITEMKEKHIIKNYSNDTLLAILFSPVKQIAANNSSTMEEKSMLIQEMIELIQSALLI